MPVPARSSMHMLQRTIVASGPAVNVNAAATNNPVPMDTDVATIGTLVVANGGGMQVLSAGVVRCVANLALNGTATRYNGRLKCLISGAPQPQRGKGGYIRNTGGHNETSLYFESYFDVILNDIITFQVDRETTNASGALVNPSESVFIVELYA